MSQSSQPDATIHPSLPAGRRLIVCDVENLVGGSSASYHMTRQCLDELDSAVCRTPNDVVIIGAGPTMTATLARSGVSSVVLGRGLSGADRALTARLFPDLVVGRFSSVQLASGDREFIRSVSELAAAGVPTDVWARPGTIAAGLAQVARSVNHVGSLRAAG